MDHSRFWSSFNLIPQPEDLGYNTIGALQLFLVTSPNKKSCFPQSLQDSPDLVCVSEPPVKDVFCHALPQICWKWNLPGEAGILYVYQLTLCNSSTASLMMVHPALGDSTLCLLVPRQVTFQHMPSI